MPVDQGVAGHQVCLVLGSYFNWIVWPCSPAADKVTQFAIFFVLSRLICPLHKVPRAKGDWHKEPHISHPTCFI